MSQHDYVIANDTAANVRADINSALLAIASNNSGATAPATTYANQWWYDSTNDILKIRSEANDAWISVATLNQTSKQFFPIVGGVAVTATGTEINKLAGLTATTGELNKLAGTPAGLTATELGYVDGVTSAIQSQIDGKIPLAADAALTGGYTTTADNDGTISAGTYTPTPAGGNMKRIVNAGAFTFAAPSAAGDYTLVVQITNTTAGAVTLSGFNKTGGDVFTTITGDDFFVHITKLNGFISATVQALQ